MNAPRPDVFSTATDSVDWAHEAIDQFQSEFAAFVADGDNCHFFVDFDEKTGEHIYKFKIFKPAPSRMRKLATEAIAHSKNSFDQSNFAAISCFRVVKKSVYFPWATTPTDLDRLLIERDIPEKLWPAFRVQEPYPRSNEHPGGDDLIRNLATIANRKHTIGLSFATVVPSRFLGKAVINLAPGEHVKINPSAWSPVNNEVEIVRWIGRSPLKVYEGSGVTVHIGFDEPTLPKTMDVAFGLTEFAGRAESFLKAVKALCE